MSPRRHKLLKLACVLTLTSLALMSWGILHPKPLAVIAAMSIGQGVGILGVLLFGGVVAPDIRAVLRRRGSMPPPPPSSSGSAAPPPPPSSSESAAPPPSSRGF